MGSSAAEYRTSWFSVAQCDCGGFELGECHAVRYSCARRPGFPPAERKVALPQRCVELIRMTDLTTLFVFLGCMTKQAFVVIFANPQHCGKTLVRRLSIARHLANPPSIYQNIKKSYQYL